MSSEFRLLSVIPSDIMRNIMPYLIWKEQRLLVRLRIPHLTRYIKTCWLRGLLKANIFKIANTFGSPFPGLIIERKKSRRCTRQSISVTGHKLWFNIIRNMDLVNKLKFIGQDKPNNITLEANGTIIAQTNIIDKDGIIRFHNMDKLWLFITIVSFNQILLVLSYTNPPVKEPVIFSRGLDIANRKDYCILSHEVPWGNDVLIYYAGMLGLKLK